MEQSEQSQFTRAQQCISDVLHAIDLELIEPEVGQLKLIEMEKHFVAESSLPKVHKEAIESLFKVAKLQLKTD